MAVMGVDTSCVLVDSAAYVSWSVLALCINQMKVETLAVTFAVMTTT